MKIFWRKTAFLSMLTLIFCSCIKPDKEVITVSFYSIDIDAVQSESFKFEISANCLWTIECSASWLNFSPSKALGDKTVEIHAAPNTSLNSRSTSFFIKGEQANEEIKVMQKGEAPTIVLRENARTVVAAGGEIDAEVTTNIETEITSDVSWIKRNTTKVMSSSSYYFIIEPNTDLVQRVGKITFRQVGNGAVSQVLTITQQGENPDIILSPNSLSFEVEGGVKGVEVTTNVPWKVTIDPAKTWVKVTQSIETKTMGTSTCFFAVEENKRADLREASILFSRDGAPELNRLLSITQLAAAPTIKFVPTEIVSAAAAGKKDSVLVDANFSWTVDLSETASWITDVEVIESPSKCRFKISPNTGVGSRSTKIVFKQVNGTFTRAYTISQNGSTPEINILYPPETIKGEGGYVLVFITSNVAWDFEVDQPWLQIERGAVTSSGVETEYLRCSAPKNTDSAPRLARITLRGENITKVVNIIQSSGDIQLSVPTTQIDVPADETTRELTITSNVQWSALVPSTVDWIEVKRAPVTKVAPHLGDSTVLVSVVKNTSLKSRQGVITIKQTNGTKEATVTVNQEAATPLFKVTPSKTIIKGTGDDLTLVIDANFPVALVGVDNSWVELKSQSSDGKVYSFTVKPTTLSVYRTAEITFKHKDGDVAFTPPSYTVVQKGATVANADSLALITLYQSTAGFLWNNHAWTLSEPVSKWGGITLSDVVNGEKRVEVIDLHSCGLFGTLNAGVLVGAVPFENLTHLNKLDLSGNLGLSGSLPVSLYKNTALVEINLSSCSFSNSSTGRNIPEEWGGTIASPNLPNLKVLKLNNNALSGTIPTSIRDHPYWSLLWNPAVNILPQRGGVTLLVP